MEVDRRAFLATVGVGALERMSPEDKAEELEHYMIHMLEEEHAEKEEPLSEDEKAELEEQERTSRRGTGSLFSSMRELEPMPLNATLEDFFRLRFAPARHVLQSANHALMTGQPERTVLACLLHDTVQNLIKVDHGYWGAQMIEPYVDEEVSWAIRVHQALRFFPDESVGYEYPQAYVKMFGGDYTLEPYIIEEYERAKKHKWYMTGRMICVNDLYSFDPNLVIQIEQFEEIIARNFKQPEAD